ncbi:MAG: hypothetical protein GTO40_02430 [Deltaproteobacteria bacterium]|nr:hypothetical protein [Deltaproteobacteria bacterium]
MNFSLSRRYIPSGISLLIVLVLFGVASGPKSSAAETSFKGKTVRILVGFSPGGGHDLEARIFARHLPKYLPGNPNVIVQNMPGASGLIMDTYLYNRAKPDGLTWGIVPTTPFLHVSLGEKVNFDLSKMKAIWSVGGYYGDIVRDFVGAKTATELVKVDPSKIVIGGRTAKGSACIKSKLALQLVGIKGYKAVCAYRGTADIRAAMERGEVSYFNANDAHLKGRGAFVDMHSRGMVFPMWQNGYIDENGKIVRSPTVDRSVPTSYEVYKELYGKEPSGLVWELYKAVNINISRLVRTWIVPPGTPNVKIIRASIEKMAGDPAFVSDWERTYGQELAPLRVPTETAEKLKNDFLKPAPWQEDLRKFVSR